VGVARADDDGSARLLGELPRFEGDNPAIGQGNLYGMNGHIWFNFFSLRTQVGTAISLRGQSHGIATVRLQIASKGASLWVANAPFLFGAAFGLDTGADTQSRYQCAVSLDVNMAKVRLHSFSASDQQKKSAPGVVVFFVSTQVVGKLVDARGKQRNLHLG